MVGAHQNLNGSRYLTTPLSGMVCHPWTSTCYPQRPQPTALTKLESIWAIVWCYLRGPIGSAILVELRLVTERKTDERTDGHTMTAYTALA